MYKVYINECVRTFSFKDTTMYQTIDVLKLEIIIIIFK